MYFILVYIIIIVIIIIIDVAVIRVMFLKRQRWPERRLVKNILISPSLPKSGQYAYLSKDLM